MVAADALEDTIIGDFMTSESGKNRYAVLIGVSISFAAVIVSAIQVYAAIQNNKLVEAQTIESFIPHLKDKDTKDLALIAMSRYVEREVVNEMASLLKSEIAIEALAKKGTVDERAASEKVIDKLERERSTLVEQMFSELKMERIAATTSLIRNWDHNAQLLETALIRAKQTPENKAGIINTLTLFLEFEPLLLDQFTADLEELYRRIWENGPRTRSLVERMRAHMRGPAA